MLANPDIQHLTSDICFQRVPSDAGKRARARWGAWLGWLFTVGERNEALRRVFGCCILAFAV
jgi:hypothetical protein